MMNTNRKTPNLRFKGFTDDWEQGKLNEFLSVSNLKNTENKYNKKDVLSVSGEYGIVNQIDFQGRSFAGASVSNYGIVEKGDIVYTKSPLKLNPYGIIKTNRINNGIVSTLYAIYKTKENCDSKFIEHYFNLDSRLNQYLKPLVNKGAKNDMKVSSENALIGEVCFPQIAEQALIVDLLDHLDIYITLHQRKLEKLKVNKRALLQKMFPQNGCTSPEVRFKGFTDDWEQHKLSQITTRVTRKNGGQSDLPLTISAQDGLVDQRKYFNRQVASRDMSNYYLIKKGEFAYNKSYSEGYPFGAVKRLDYYDMGALSTLYILFEITDNNISSDFIVSYYMTHLWYKEISKRAAEGARNHGLLNISTEDFFDSELNIPNSIEEQIKIGNFIKQFDKFITLHQRKLDCLVSIKKALLQQLFV